MSKKKGKFDLTHLVHQGWVKDGQTLYFVSDPTKTCLVARQANGEFKINAAGEVTTLHAFALKLLGQDPPGHASRWFRDANGKTLFDLWNGELAEAA